MVELSDVKTDRREVKMKIRIVFALGLSLLAPTLFGQTNQPASIPEEARKHFVEGATLFKDAKTPDDFVIVESEFKQAVDLALAPQWPEARYNLGLAKEAAGDYAGAMADLKIYLGFKLPDAEARIVQDKVYALEAKAGEIARKQKQAEDEANSPAAQLERFFKSLDGGLWRCEHSDTVLTGSNGHRSRTVDSDAGHDYIAVNGQTMRWVFVAKPTYGTNGYVNGVARDVDYDPAVKPFWTAAIPGRAFSVNFASDVLSVKVDVVMSDNGQSITEKITGTEPDAAITETRSWVRIK